MDGIKNIDYNQIVSWTTVFSSRKTAKTQMCPRFEFRTVEGAGQAPHLEPAFLGEASQAVLDFLGRA